MIPLLQSIMTATVVQHNTKQKMRVYHLMTILTISVSENYWISLTRAPLHKAYPLMVTLLSMLTTLATLLNSQSEQDFYGSYN